MEVWLLAEARMGLMHLDLAIWLLAAIALNALFALLLCLAYQRLQSTRGWIFGSLLGIHSSMWYRFEICLSSDLLEWRVAGGVLLLSFASLVLGWVLDRALRLRWDSLLWGASFIGILLSLQEAKAPSGMLLESQPNVVLITLDTTRSDAFGAYGSSNPTPRIDRLAAEGALFTQSFSLSPLTEPSHLSILTGLSPNRTGVLANGIEFGDRDDYVPNWFQQNGYSTAAFVSGYPLDSRFGWSQGFDVYDDGPGARPGLSSLQIVRVFRQLFLPVYALRERKGGKTIDRALSWIGEHHRETFFLWVHLFDPHGPYLREDGHEAAPSDGPSLPLPPYWPSAHRSIRSIPWLVESYHEEVSYVDGEVGRLVDGLETLGVLDSSLLVLTADHGESLSEHGYLFTHGENLYDPSLRVPLLFRMPGIVKPQKVPCQLSNSMVAQTLLDAAGAGEGEDSLMKVLGGEACSDRPIFASTLGRLPSGAGQVLHSLRYSGIKLVRGQTSMECFHLPKDPGEERPMKCPKLLRDMLSDELKKAGNPMRDRLDKDTRESLEAMGYIH
jgi:choline-sulfatase